MTNPTIPALLDLEPIRERCDKASPGKWESKNWRICALEPFLYICDTATNAASRTEENADNAAFMAGARTDIPPVLAELTQLRRWLLEFGGHKPSCYWDHGNCVCGWQQIREALEKVAIPETKESQ